MLDKIKKDITKFISDKKSIKESWLKKNHPVDIAEALFDLEKEKINTFTNMLENENLANIIIKADEELQINILKTKSIDEIIDIFSYMATDEIIDIMENLAIGKRKEVFKKMKQGEVQTLQNLLGYDAESAGGIMTTEYIILKKQLTSKEALIKIKEIAPETEIIDVVYIINDKRELVGIVDLRDILIAADNKLLEDIMNENIVTVTAETDQELVAQLVAKYDLTVIPVVNKNNHLIGIITVDDIIDVIEAENTEDILRLAGISEEETFFTKPEQSIKMRLPWMIGNVFLNLIAVTIISSFEDTIAQITALAAFLPMITDMGGNIGIQALSVSIRSLALGEIGISDIWQSMRKEVKVGIVNGIVLGSLLSILAFLLEKDIMLGVIAGLALMVNVLIASIIGGSMPFIIKKIGKDPAMMSGPFITTITDITGVSIYLGLSTIFLFKLF